jgi:hypothetical protein
MTALHKAAVWMRLLFIPSFKRFNMNFTAGKLSRIRHWPLLLLWCPSFLGSAVAGNVHKVASINETAPPLESDTTYLAHQSFKKSWIKLNNHQYIKVTSLDSLRGQTLYYTLRGRSRSVAVNQIAELKIYHGTQVGKGVVIGCLVGVAQGGFALLLLNSLGDVKGVNAPAVLLSGAAFGGLMGALFAALFPHHYRFRLKRLSDGQKAKVIADVLSGRLIRPVKVR